VSRNPDYQFISTDTASLESDLIAMYEKLTGTSVTPASPVSLFIRWVAAALLQERALNNYTANQNLPSRADGENLDALADLFYIKERPEASPSVCTVRFFISEAQEENILIPKGTRVTDASRTLYWETTTDAYVEAGETYADVQCSCVTPGTVGNGYALGQINSIVDVFDYYSACENITVSAAGSDAATDEEFYDLMRDSQDAYSVAGPNGAYIYWAKTVSNEIVDVVPTSPEPGVVAIYTLMEGGEIADEEVKAAVLETCSDSLVRPLTDQVTVEDPEIVTYDIDLTYYMYRGAKASASSVATAVSAGVQEFVDWECAALGRDINPSYLIQLLMATGIKRVEVAAPAFAELKDGTEKTVPQIARVGTITIRSGGYEDE
jgi:phage-related baseplate assembly protein